LDAELDAEASAFVYVSGSPNGALFGLELLLRGCGHSKDNCAEMVLEDPYAIIDGGLKLYSIQDHNELPTRKQTFRGTRTLFQPLLSGGNFIKVGSLKHSAAHIGAYMERASSAYFNRVFNNILPIAKYDVVARLIFALPHSDDAELSDNAHKVIPLEVTEIVLNGRPIISAMINDIEYRSRRRALQLLQEEDDPSMRTSVSFGSATLSFACDEVPYAKDKNGHPYYVRDSVATHNLFASDNVNDARAGISFDMVDETTVGLRIGTVGLFGLSGDSMSGDQVSAAFHAQGVSQSTSHRKVYTLSAERVPACGLGQVVVNVLDIIPLELGPRTVNSRVVELAAAAGLSVDNSLDTAGVMDSVSGSFAAVIEGETTSMLDQVENENGSGSDNSASVSEFCYALCRQCGPTYGTTCDPTADDNTFRGQLTFRFTGDESNMPTYAGVWTCAKMRLQLADPTSHCDKIVEAVASRRERLAARKAIYLDMLRRLDSNWPILQLFEEVHDDETGASHLNVIQSVKLSEGVNSLSTGALQEHKKIGARIVMGKCYAARLIEFALNGNERITSSTSQGSSFVTFDEDPATSRITADKFESPKRVNFINGDQLEQEDAMSASPVVDVASIGLSHSEQQGHARLTALNPTTGKDAFRYGSMRFAARVTGFGIDRCPAVARVVLKGLGWRFLSRGNWSRPCWYDQSF
jgi:hypothetical protein